MSFSRQQYFNVVQPLELSFEEFNTQWAFVDNFWTRFSSNGRENGDKWISYVCRLSKPRPSSGRKEDIPPEKRRATWKRPSIDCQAKIKVTWFAATRRVRVEKLEDAQDHCHSIDEVDMRKRSKFIRDAVGHEAVKSYNPTSITKVIKEEIEKEHLDSGVTHLKRQEVANIKLKLVGPMNAHLVGEGDLESDILSATKFLEGRGYQVERFSIAKSSEGFCFASMDQLESLARYGWLTLLDSTHNTNKHSWRLFTLYVRNGYGCWSVGAHFFVSREDSETVAEGLKTTRRFASRWNPRYMLCDQSSVEANSVVTAFPGLKAGEQECDILLCTVHIVRTWMKNIYHGPTLDKMVQAMHKRTKAGCEGLVQDAIRTCPVEANVKYIRRNYVNNSQKWGLWARDHSPLLLQVTSTNALESYHSELKTRTSPTYGLIGKHPYHVYSYACRRICLKISPIYRCLPQDSGA